MEIREGRGGRFGPRNPGGRVGHSDPGNPGGRGGGVKKPCHPSGGGGGFFLE